MSTPRHEAWEAARQLRNEAATRFIWRTQGTTPGTGHPDDPDASHYLAEFYKWDAEMDRLGLEIDGDEAEASA